MNRAKEREVELERQARTTSPSTGFIDFPTREKELVLLCFCLFAFCEVTSRMPFLI